MPPPRKTFHKNQVIPPKIPCSKLRRGSCGCVECRGKTLNYRTKDEELPRESTQPNIQAEQQSAQPIQPKPNQINVDQTRPAQASKPEQQAQPVQNQTQNRPSGSIDPQRQAAHPDADRAIQRQQQWQVPTQQSTQHSQPSQPSQSTQQSIQQGVQAPVVQSAPQIKPAEITTGALNPTSTSNSRIEDLHGHLLSSIGYVNQRDTFLRTLDQASNNPEVLHKLVGDFTSFTYNNKNFQGLRDFNPQNKEEAISMVKEIWKYADWMRVDTKQLQGAEPKKIAEFATTIFPTLKPVIDRAYFNDMESKSTRISIYQLSLFNESTLDKVNSNDGNIFVGNKSVVDLDDMESLRQYPVTAYGHQGYTYAHVPAMYVASKRYVLVGNLDRVLSASAVAHEYGHFLGHTQRWDMKQYLKEQHIKLFSKLSLYLRQGGEPGNFAGCRELLAEGIAMLLKKGKEHTSYIFSSEFVNFLMKGPLSERNK